MLEVFKMGYRIHSLNQALSYFAHTWDLSIFFAMCFGGSKLFQSSLSFFQGLFFFCSPTFETIFVILLKWTTIGNDFRTNFQKTFLLSKLPLVQVRRRRLFRDNGLPSSSTGPRRSSQLLCSSSAAAAAEGNRGGGLLLILLALFCLASSYFVVDV